MTENHPITPPPELVQEWCATEFGRASDIATQAARWAADQELEACVEHLKRIWSPSDTIDSLCTARRPKPPSLKEQSLALLDKIQGSKEAWDISDLNVVRRALEALDD